MPFQQHAGQKLSQVSAEVKSHEGRLKEAQKRARRRMKCSKWRKCNEGSCGSEHGQIHWERRLGWEVEDVWCCKGLKRRSGWSLFNLRVNVGIPRRWRRSQKIEMRWTGLWVMS